MIIKTRQTVKSFTCGITTLYLSKGVGGNSPGNGIGISPGKGISVTDIGGGEGAPTWQGDGDLPR